MQIRYWLDIPKMVLPNKLLHLDTFYVLALWSIKMIQSGESKNQIKKNAINFFRQICCLMPFFMQCAFSCVSSAPSTVCRSNYIAYRQKVSRQCVKTCGTSNPWSVWKNSCTAYTQRAFLQCVWACGSSDHQFEHNNSYTGNIWKASLLNGSACVSWGKRL